MATEPTTELLELEATTPEVKRYQRQKLQAGIAGTVVSFVWLAVFAFGAGPELGEQTRQWFAGNDWLRLLITAMALGVTLEALTLPLDFWSGFILEHRYQLSNQTLGGWLWKHVKSAGLGGALGMALLYGLYAVLWWTGA